MSLPIEFGSCNLVMFKLLLMITRNVQNHPKTIDSTGGKPQIESQVRARAINAFVFQVAIWARNTRKVSQKVPKVAIPPVERPAYSAFLRIQVRARLSKPVTRSRRTSTPQSHLSNEKMLADQARGTHAGG